MVEVGVAPTSSEHSPQVGIAADMDTEDGTPTHTFIPAVADSDSDSEDERRGEPVDAGAGAGIGIGNMAASNGDMGIDVDGSDSDGMEDIAPPFVPPIQTQYNGGTNGSAPAEPAPPSALENLWVIDP
jgi:hypothetical protein